MNINFYELASLLTKVLVAATLATALILTSCADTGTLAGAF